VQLTIWQMQETRGVAVVVDRRQVLGCSWADGVIWMATVSHLELVVHRGNAATASWPANSVDTRAFQRDITVDRGASVNGGSHCSSWRTYYCWRYYAKI